MVSFLQATVGISALLGLVQFCPAPFAAIPVVIAIDMGSAAAWAGAAGGIAGGAAATASAIENGKKNKKVKARGVISRIKRQDDGNQLAWEECRDDVEQATLGFSAPAAGSILVTGLPATCMTLSTVITGKFDEGNPVPMGSDSIQFNNVSDDIISEIQDALNARE